MFTQLGDVILGTAANKNKTKAAIHQANSKKLSESADKYASEGNFEATQAQSQYATLQAAGPNTGPLAELVRTNSKEQLSKSSKRAFEANTKASKLRDQAVKHDSKADEYRNKPGNLLDVAASFIGVTK